MEITDDVREAQRWRDVLGKRVEAALVAPEQRDVPGVGVLVDRVHRRRDPALADGAVRVAEARPLQLVGVTGRARRDLRAARVAAEVDVELAARPAETRLLPDEALEVAPVLRDAV